MKTTLQIIGLLTIVLFSSFKGEKDAGTTATTANIEGIVIDETSGETLVGVEVFIEGTDLKTYTDFDGNFVFNNMNVGEYSISAKLISYKSKKININTSNNTNLKLKMNLQN
ncbi:carboxypeptidase-like regulatory domain-containing protein [Labilibacter sediminis]|nr:carboxypeptidase-like regulatory domain-containing protein [Labilibacter sediminis]